jgi:MFS family permease
MEAMQQVWPQTRDEEIHVLASKPLEQAEKAHIGLSEWSTLLLIVFCYGFYNLDKSLLPILIEPIKAEFALSDSQMGMLTGLATSVPFALACIPVGLLADRMSRRNLLAILVIGWSLATGLTSFARSVFALFITRVGIGAFEAGFTPVSLSMLSDLFPLRLRSTVMGLFSLGAPVGLFMGMVAGGYIEDNHGWRTAFLLAGAPGVVLGIVFYLTTREPVRGRFDGPTSAPEKTGFGSVLRNIWSNKALFNIAAGMTWCASMLAVFAVWTPSFLRRSFELTASEAGFNAGLIAGLGSGLGAAIGGILSDRVGGDSQWRKLVVPIAGVGAAIPFGLAALLWSTELTTTVALLAVSAALSQFYLGSCYAQAATIAGPNLRASTLSVLLVLFNLISYSLGAGLIGKLSDELSSYFGAEALRYAYACGFAFSALGVMHFSRALTVLKQVTPK